MGGWVVGAECFFFHPCSQLPILHHKQSEGIKKITSSSGAIQTEKISKRGSTDKRSRAAESQHLIQQLASVRWLFDLWRTAALAQS